jgi:hypothetical protein
MDEIWAVGASKVTVEFQWLSRPRLQRWLNVFRPSDYSLSMGRLLLAWMCVTIRATVCESRSSLVDGSKDATVATIETADDAVDDAVDKLFVGRFCG